MYLTHSKCHMNIGAIPRRSFVDYLYPRKEEELAFLGAQVVWKRAEAGAGEFLSFRSSILSPLGFLHAFPARTSSPLQRISACTEATEPFPPWQQRLHGRACSQVVVNIEAAMSMVKIMYLPPRGQYSVYRLECVLAELITTQHSVSQWFVLSFIICVTQQCAGERNRSPPSLFFVPISCRKFVFTLGV
jgi:hypothetical protein